LIDLGGFQACSFLTSFRQLYNTAPQLLHNYLRLPRTARQFVVHTFSSVCRWGSRPVYKRPMRGAARSDRLSPKRDDGAQRRAGLSPVHTVAEKCDCRRIRQLSPLSRRFLRQSHFSATVWTGLYTVFDGVMPYNVIYYQSTLFATSVCT